MKKHLLLVTLLAVALAGMAQVPGFRGKKFIITYDAGINHPILVGRTGKLPMLYHNVALEYVVARQWTVGVHYGFMTYNAPNEKNIFGSYYSDVPGYRPQDFKGRYTQHTVSFIAKKFYRRKGYLAPVGRYVMFGAYYQYVTDHFYESRISNNYYFTNYALVSKKAIAHYGGITVGLGRNFVVARYMLIDIGCALSFSPALRNLGGNEEGYMIRELTLRNLFQLRLGLGFLAF